MSISHTLEAAHNALVTRYKENEPAILSLCRTLREDIIPNVLDEMNEGGIQYNIQDLEDWASDTGSVFRILKRHKYTTSFALQALRKSLVWRITTLSRCLSPVEFPARLDVFRLLPPSCRDPLGRPILVFNLAALFELASGSLDDAKDLILWLDDAMRRYLQRISKDSGQRGPVLQFVAIVNVQSAAASNLATDLVTWYYQDVQAHYPGIMGAVFIQGHSWVHSRMWSIFKRILPTSAQSKVSFLSREELAGHFGVDVLPEDFGGSLPPLNTLQDPLFGQLPPRRRRSRSSSSSEHSLPQLQIPDPRPSNPSPRTLRLDTSIPATHSPFNPFFGYPVSPTSLNPRYGRRRKRDLLKTLAYLWWAKWKGSVLWVLTLAVAFWLSRWRLRIWLNRRRQMISQRAR